jgi:hypothetical protein
MSACFFFGVARLIRDKIFTGRKTKNNNLRLAVTFCLTATVRLLAVINDGYCPVGSYGIIPRACCRLYLRREPLFEAGERCFPGVQRR